MRKLLAPLVLAAAVAGLVVGADLSGAGNGGTMQAVPPSSVAPATVTVSNVDDIASTCEEPAAPAFTGTPVEVSLMLTGDNGVMQANTVTPDAMGNWSQTYTGLPVGTYTVTGTCQVVANGANGAGPLATATFTYTPVQFVVTAPATAPAAATPAPAAPIVASPSFTG